ncbi:PaeR7I family type II restriction endonuclease [Pararhodospirillum photometricum]|nr:PaeR7I family type II restriction endonuclease [Pararhodospirillum photometricum]
MLDLVAYEGRARAAVRAFWQARGYAHARQQEGGSRDQGERAGVTAGKNMDAFVDLVTDLVRANGLGDALVHRQRALLTLPGHFRATKQWDVLIFQEKRLIAALEFKSQAGPSFSSNFNNRCEEAIGTALDLWTACREGAFGPGARPFVGWLMLVEDAPGSRAPVRDTCPHFPLDPAFTGASYLERYTVLCQRLMQERLYTAAGVMASPRDTDSYRDLSPETSLRAFLAALAGHAAAQALG